MRIKKVIFKLIRFFSKNLAARFVGVRFGQNCRLIIEDFGTEPWLIEIGNNVTITSGVKLLTHDGSTWLARDENGRRYKYGRIKIGNNVFIGTNSIILPNITIEDNVIIGAGSVVTKSIVTNSVFVGNPAKYVKSYNDVINNYILNSISDKNWNKGKSYKENIEFFLESK